MKTQYRNILPGYDTLKIICLFTAIFILLPASWLYAQCPGNIDFEKGDFTGWQCWTGDVGDATGINKMNWDATSPGPPVSGRQTMLSYNPGDGLDPYGLFPKNCPNGSGHSILLGNNAAIHKGEAVSYTFTIPAGQNDFSLYFNYAVVLQNPGHVDLEQPRFVVTVENLTDGVETACQLAPFIAGGGLPGFKLSAIRDPGGATTVYKDWAAASINLDGLAGKTIRVFFRTSDCTLIEHFGYAYLDIESDCSSKIFGSAFCPRDPFLDLTAPPGFQFYRWFNKFNTTIGTQRILRLDPMPQPGDSVFVELIPYDGYGCVDTLFAYLSDDLNIVANAGPDKQFCANDTLQLGEQPKRGLIYKWFPETGLSDPDIANPVVVPTASIQYTLTVSSPGGGCQSTDVVNLVKKCDRIDIQVPNAFTPGGNTSNNRLRPFLFGFSKLNYFKIYNRSGQLLYNANSDTPGWDGNFKGKAQTTQTVVWMIEAVDAYGRIERRQGTSILIR